MERRELLKSVLGLVLVGDLLPQLENLRVIPERDFDAADVTWSPIGAGNARFVLQYKPEGGEWRTVGEVEETNPPEEPAFAANFELTEDGLKDGETVYLRFALEDPNEVP